MKRSLNASQSKTLYSVNEKLIEKLKNWKELKVDSSGNLKMKVSRQNVWEKQKRMCANLSRFSSLENQLYVVADQGGPLLEHFVLANSAAQERGNIEDLVLSIDEIPNHDIKTSVIELEELPNADEFREKASFESEFQFEASYMKPFVTKSDKDEFLICIALHYTVLVPLSERNQFVNGLKI
ncbi:Hypothetical predicted protein [Paramuricea clavata]|uniref:Uncharacterized protein n=1 Tax=Paramuricea clavata TaxID=317549 RepID=A0A7D9EX43_PARCT|nr:Hypothetical predicted protein [Paramuricea clavata]